MTTQQGSIKEATGRNFSNKFRMLQPFVLAEWSVLCYLSSLHKKHK